MICRLALCALACTVVVACTSSAPQQPSRPVSIAPSPDRTAEPIDGNLVVHGPKLNEDGFLLSSSFERPVCGYYGRPDPGCEFGVEGNVRTGPFHPRTGDQALAIDRASPKHMGALALVSLPADAPTYWGVAHRIPSIPDEVWDERHPYLEISQMSPTDGTVHGWPMEVRLYPDRTLGLGSWSEPEAVRTTVQVPVDTWFYVVAEVANGDAATQQLWVYDENDALVDHVSTVADTRVDWVHELRMGQKVGGNTATPMSLVFYADDWYIGPENRGPIHIT